MGQCVGEIKGIFEVVYVIQPFAVKHVTGQFESVYHLHAPNSAVNCGEFTEKAGEIGKGIHILAPAAQRNNTRQLVLVRMRHPDGVIPARRKRPDSHLLRVDGLLLLYPVEQGAVQAVRGGRVVGSGRAVAGTRDLEHEGCDTELAPALHPYGELGAVSIQAGEDNDEGG